MTDTQAIDAIIEILEDTVALMQQYDPMAQAMPGVAALVAQVDALKAARTP